MKFLITVVVVLPLVLAYPSFAAPDSDVMIPQMDPNSILVQPMNEAATPAKNAKTRSIADDLKDILMDHKMSQLGRANAAISSQYGAQPIVETPPETPAEATVVAPKKAKKTEEKPAQHFD